MTAPGATAPNPVPGSTERAQRGAARLAELADEGRAAAHALLAEVCPDLPRLAVEFAYGDIHSRPGLDSARRELVSIGALVALGDTAVQLRAHLGSALTSGLGPDELVEAVLQALPYAGFPRVINAMLVVREVLQERGLLPVVP
ncbi:carboxymuconolactone decarboxylase family protein [Amycolatopsis sp. QT-25]|uniref:carboxymuconolactone decarboxylase family protein n=1 Tax=Amycolatopsis sp. QT-25 TaxID=3034022 RepID=UPI0023EAA86F|nr:carboxymuconolactone decarboxylase family protein [Amycolatopsis sp. QT-25]WET81606.1 carboxymuconolactone decarboxylase family protein [Amycolatopsis sp. QT-25]